MITEKKLEKMFEHYIARKKYNQESSSGSQDSLWSAGECEEAEKWLKCFGADLSYETIQPMISGKAEVQMKRVTGPCAEGNFDDLLVFVPSRHNMIVISEGSGDNLLPEDKKEGWVDYINYTYYETDTFSEEDGGMYMTSELVQEKYSCLAECVPEILDEIYDDSTIDYVVLSDLSGFPGYYI